jgi:hypothetical protein
MRFLSPSQSQTKSPRAGALAGLLLLLPRLSAAAWTPNFVDSTLNVSQIAVLQPESRGRFLGSPSLLRLPGAGGGALLASHDEFGPGTTWGQRTAFVRASRDGGQTWADAGAGAAAGVLGMYWATLFSRPGDDAVYLLGVSNDGDVAGEPAQAAISRSTDGGATWTSPAAKLTGSNASFSTGPTPVLLAFGRLWRALEHNTRPGWASGYSVCVISAAADAPDLLDASAWTLSGELPFEGAVAAQVPAAWRRPDVASTFGWLEGGAVDPGDGGASGIRVVLRVNSLPAANKAALVSLAAPGATPVFEQFIDPFPGGLSKFSVRRDAASGLFVSLTNNISDESVSLPPTCAEAAPLPPGPLPCCGFLTTCLSGGGAPACLWCHAVARNVLTLSVSERLESGWRVAATVLADDTGTPGYLSQLLIGFQYVDWQFDGAQGEDIIYAVRAAYRGSNQYHNANRHLFGIINGWREVAKRAAVEK